MSSLFNPTTEHKLLRQTLRDFVRHEVEPQANFHDREERFNLDLFRKLGPLGLLGLTVPAQWGGAGMDAIASVIAHEELSFSDPGFCLAYLAHSVLLVNNFAVNANPEQKKQHLSRMMSGETVGAMAMSEPDVGTDVLNMRTTARRQGEYFILNGRKMWITNGVVDEDLTPCDYVLVYARTGTTPQGQPLLSLFLVEKGFEGFSVGQKIKGKCGMRASNTAELVFDNCKVPITHLIGKENEALKHMMRNLEIERVTLAAMALGIAKRALHVMNEYASKREAFGHPIRHFGQIQHYIARSYAQYMSARTYVYHTAQNMDLTQPSGRLDSDGVKLVATTMAKQVADAAIQVLGGYGYVNEYLVERLWRDAKLLEIGGGTLEAHEKNITKDLARHDISQWD